MYSPIFLDSERFFMIFFRRQYHQLVILTISNCQTLISILMKNCAEVNAWLHIQSEIDFSHKGSVTQCTTMVKYLVRFSPLLTGVLGFCTNPTKAYATGRYGCDDQLCLAYAALVDATMQSCFKVCESRNVCHLLYVVESFLETVCQQL